MGFIETLFRAIAQFYAWPFHQMEISYDYTCGINQGVQCPPQRDWVLTAISAFLVFIATAVAIALIVILIRWIIRKIHWYANRERCHQCHKWTLHRSDGAFLQACTLGMACCEDCTLDHRLNYESRIVCPYGHGQMEKKLTEDIAIYDFCNTCKCHVYSDEDFDKMLDSVKSRSYNSGTGTGLAIGIATGISV